MDVNEKQKAKAEFEGRKRLVKVLTWQGIQHAPPGRAGGATN